MKLPNHCTALKSSFVLALIFGLAACANPSGYQKTIGKFEQATVKVAESANIYILRLNDFEISHAFQKLKKNPNSILNIDRVLKPKFDPKSIAVRQKIIKSFQDYVSLLGHLADTKQSDEWKKATSLLKTNLEQASTSIAGLVPSSGSDPFDLKKYAGPVSSAVGVVGEIFIAQKKEAALDKAVTGMEVPIQTISSELKEDLNSAFRLRATAIGEGLTQSSLNYEQIQARMRQVSDTSLEYASLNRDRIALLEQLENDVKVSGRLAVNEGSIGKVMDDFNKAHGKLVAYAKSDKKPEDVDALAAAVDTFLARATALYAVFREIQLIQQGG